MLVARGLLSWCSSEARFVSDPELSLQCLSERLTEAKWADSLGTSLANPWGGLGSLPAADGAFEHHCLREPDLSMVSVPGDLWFPVGSKFGT